MALSIEIPLVGRMLQMSICHLVEVLSIVVTTANGKAIEQTFESRKPPISFSIERK